MLFNSYGFIFIFLPVVLLGFYTVGRFCHHRIGVAWLVVSSLFFYGWWNPVYLWLILISIGFNYGLGVVLCFRNLKISRKAVLIIGILFNLGLLGYFKYAEFFVDNLNHLTGNTYHLDTIILPLAISFFTFQQITYIVDVYNSEVHEYDFLHYCLFVLFFPQLIAGPIVHHSEMLPQFLRDVIYKFNRRHFAIGLTIFIIGLFKKIVLADNVAVYVTPMFNAAEQGHALTVFQAWKGALAYTLQIYFDFSGYSDMAIGLAGMFGILLPLNFHSPYKAVNIIEFWKRWHITLSRFLRDYLYIPLGGNRKGSARRYSNLFITMLIGGLWHGAGWTFVAWGALHGFYLVVNHAWRSMCIAFNYNTGKPSWWGRKLSQIITFIAVVIAWVFFRAESFDSAICILKAMLSIHELYSQIDFLEYLNFFFHLDDYLFSKEMIFTIIYYFRSNETIPVIILLLIVWIAPNTQEFMQRNMQALLIEKVNIKPLKSALLTWRPNVAWGIVLFVMSMICIVQLSSYSEFLYFQF